MNGGAFRIFKRKTGVFYAEDTATRRQFSLKTRERSEADAQLLALSEARRNPSLNAKIGMLYLGTADPECNTRTWQDVMNAYQARGGKEATVERSERAFTSWRFDDLRKCVVTRTRAEDFLSIMNEQRSTAATHYLRRLHNFARDLGWLPMPIIADALWPKPKRRKKRAITEDEHRLIIEAEKNPEQRDYYEMLWLTDRHREASGRER